MDGDKFQRIGRKLNKVMGREPKIIEFDRRKWRVINYWCHHCQQGSLFIPVKWGRHGVTIQFRCADCKHTEWRRVLPVDDGEHV